MAEVTGRVRSIRRFPVKSMGGEALDSVELDERGLVGDRWFAVVDDDGRLASGKDSRRFRRRDAVFDFSASRTAAGVAVTAGGRAWRAGDPTLDAELSRQMGDPVRVLPEGEVPHQDAAGVSLVGTASLRWCAEHWGGTAEPRRTRTNLVLETDEPFVEEGWVGQELSVGSARLRLVGRTQRCRMVDIDQDDVRPGTPWLKRLGDERDLVLGVYAEVARPGTVSVGDVVAPGRGGPDAGQPIQ